MIYRPFLLVVAGHSFSGKTTQQRKFAEARILQRSIDFDELRLEHYPDFMERCSPEGEFDLDIDIRLTEAFSWTLPHYLGKAIEKGSTLISGTFSFLKYKQGLIDWLRGSGRDIERVIVRLEADIDEEEVMKRVAERRARDDKSPHKDFAAYQKSLSFQEPWPADVHVHRIDTGAQTPDETFSEILGLIEPFKVEA